MPLDRDLTIVAIAAAIAPAMPNSAEVKAGGPKLRINRDFWDGVNETFGYAMLELIEAGKAAIVDESTGQALPAITFEKFNDVCSGGRRLIAPTGVVLWVMDWIS